MDLALIDLDFSVLDTVNKFVKFIENMKQAGKDLNGEDINGQTLLMTAVKLRITMVLNLLINEGASVDLANRYSRETPLFSAARLGHETIVDVLIEAKANLDMSDINGNTPLKIALDYGYTNVAKVLIKAGANPNITNKSGLGPLYSAVKGNYVEIAETLILSGAKVNVLNIDRNTPLTIAVRFGHLELVNLLLKSGAVVNLPNVKSRTPIFYAAENECFKIVEILLEAGANVNILDVDHNTPLTLAIVNGNPEIVELLIEAGAHVDALRQIREKLLKDIKYSYTKTYPDIRKMIAYLTLIAVSEVDLQMDKFIFGLSMLKNDGCSRSLIKHILLFSPETIKPAIIKTNVGLSTYWDECKSEIFSMQGASLGYGNFPLLTFLKERNRNKLAFYFDKISFGLENILNKNHWLKKFPIYSDVIYNQLKRAQTRFDLLHKCFQMRFLYLIRKRHLSNLLYKIIEYLPVPDLINLSKSDKVLT